MFGFWGTKNVAKQIGDVVETTLVIPFMGTKYVGFETKKIHFPYEFFDDEYIRGFVYSLVAIIIKVHFPNVDRSDEKKGRIMIIVWERLAKEDALKILRGINEAVKYNEESIEFSRGCEDGTRFGAAVLGVLRADIDDPIVNQARDLAPKLHDNMRGLDIGRSSQSETLASAIGMLTLHKHIKGEYLSQDTS